MTYYVTRQAYIHDDGAFAVELAKSLDVASPDALAQRYPGEMEGYDDPREAAREAVAIRDLWLSDLRAAGESPRDPIAFTLATTSLVYPTVEDGWDAAELEQWAAAEYERLRKCEHCLAPINGAAWYRVEDAGFSDAAAYCSESCVDAARAADQDPVDALADTARPAAG
jgi:hypothetical protein